MERKLNRAKFYPTLMNAVLGVSWVAVFCATNWYEHHGKGVMWVYVILTIGTGIGMYINARMSKDLINAVIKLEKSKEFHRNMESVDLDFCEMICDKIEEKDIMEGLENIRQDIANVSSRIDENLELAEELETINDNSDLDDEITG